MKLEHKNINFEDARGTITDIFVKEPKEHCTIIFTKKGGVRANHYHKVSRQHDFIVSGSMESYGQMVGQPEITKTILKPNDLAIWEPGEAHEFIALEDTVFITFVDGLRGGDEYEKDTFRLEVPLHSLVEQSKKPS
jgi:dTDP-4-dehydrorhamnose 3,5-epimerase-like enzyme